jgi:hypothetical protein
VAASWVALIGAINLPIIKFSVKWWNTLHQGESIFKRGGPSIDQSMLTPLLLMMAACAALGGACCAGGVHPSAKHTGGMLNMLTWHASQRTAR